MGVYQMQNFQAEVFDKTFSTYVLSSTSFYMVRLTVTMLISKLVSFNRISINLVCTSPVQHRYS